jgi:hypothetical protein
MGILSSAGVIAAALVWLVLSSQPKLPVSINISRNIVVTNGFEFATVRFGNLVQRSYVGWFVTEALVAGQWIESARQHPEARMAMTVSPGREAIYRVPVPRESTEWRIHWRGDEDYGEVSRVRKIIAKLLERPFYRDTLHINFSAAQNGEAFGYSTNQIDF